MSIRTRVAEEKCPAVPANFGEFQVFATSPQSLGSHPDTYLQNVIDVAQWSESAGCTGTLVYADNSIVDPWLVAQAILANTRTLVPLVAVQPLYLHPYAAAKMVTSLAYLYGRRVILNMVAGGFKNDLVSLGDQTPHDRRYDRLVEYVKVIQLLVGSTLPVTYEGEFYRLTNAVLKPELPAGLKPEFFISGSSGAGLAAAEATGAVPIKYPEPPDKTQAAAASAANSHSGLRVGIIARGMAEEAWEIAYERFPFDRKGQIAHEMAMRVSDSSWHKRLSALSKEACPAGTYWLGPFEVSKSNCPYLVGTYSDVAQDLCQYMQLGYRTFILDIPPSAEELGHIRTVFEQASGFAGCKVQA
jgi:alkanesulfonate monooxygenase